MDSDRQVMMAAGRKQRWQGWLQAAAALACLLLAAAPSAHAACISPAGIEGEIIYNSAYKVPQYCDNTNWIAMGSGKDSGTPVSNPSPNSGDRFGSETSISGDLLLVGDYLDESDGGTGVSNAGRAYVFNVTTGALVSTLNNPSPHSSDYFGYGVAIEGNVAAVSAAWDESDGGTGVSGAGRAYVFNATTGALTLTLNNPTPHASDFFGESIAISGNLIVVGADYDESNGTTGTSNAGRAYVFNATTGALVTPLNNPSPTADDQFGIDVAIDGNVAVVGVPEDEADGGSGVSGAGRAYVFNATTGALTATLNNPSPNVDDNFGRRVAIEGNVIVVGASADESDGGTGVSGAGRAYVFNATTGALMMTLNNPSPNVDDFFGGDVAIGGNLILVGAYDDEDGTGVNSAGRVYIFNATTGILMSTLENPHPNVDDYFANDVSIEGDLAVIAAYQDESDGDAGVSNAGRVYLFRVDTDGGGGTACSPDPWTTATASAVQGWSEVIYGNNLFVALSDNGALMTSPDGITWTSRTIPELNQWNGIAYGNGVFVAVAGNGTNRVMTSPDGVTWTVRTAAQANPWMAVTFSSGLFVAVAATGTNRVMTSPDGITWTARTAAQANQWNSVTYGNGLFVAVSFDGTNRVMTSPDGITWTSRNAAAANVWLDVTYGGGQFVAVASNGANQVMTSPDGITWTGHVAALDNSWRTVTYGGGMYVALADSWQANRVMTSTDAITWTLQSVPEDGNQWRSVTYGDGKFVAVSYDGTHRVMTSGCVSGGGSIASCTITDAGNINYNADEHVPQFCNGSGWVSMVAEEGAGGFDPQNISVDNLMDLGASLASLPDSGGVQDGGTLTVNGQSLGSYDYVVIDGSVTISSGWTVANYFSSTADSKSAVVVVKGDLTINAGAIFTPGVRKLFTLIYVTGNIIDNGEVSMTARGANHSATGSNITAANIRIANGTYSGVTNPQIPATGASGATGVTNAVGNTGGAGSAGGSGGGGSGSANSATTSGAGAAGTSFSGGPGSGAYSNTSGTGQAGGANGGKGGDGFSSVPGTNRTGGGAGNPGGVGSDSNPGVDGTGGTLIVMALGSLSGNGNIRANGSNGGLANGSVTNRGGGGAGGGSVTVLYGTDSSSITPLAAGGAGGVASGGSTNMSGGAGGNGTARKLAIPSGGGGSIVGGGTCPGLSTWAAYPAAAANSWESIAFGNGMFVAVSPDGTNRVMTSPDGITWTARSVPESGNQWYSVTYGNGQFVSVALNGTNRVMTSPDGITWTARAAAQANTWRSVTYGNGLFVAVSDNGTNRVMTSPDGITWTVRTASSATFWWSVTYGNGLFVAVSVDTAAQVMTSPDGITWTTRTVPEANGWQSVTFGNGLFVAVTGTGTHRVMTSPDGINWTARTAAEANGWMDVTYGDGTFVAVADGGTHQVMTSTDGITWTGYTAAAANVWNAVGYGNGKFVSLSITGTNRIMKASCHGSGFCTSPAGTEGAMLYNNVHNVVQYCNGNVWRAIGK